MRTIVQNLDHKLTLELNRIVHHPDFQRLEGAWRGLYYLTEHVEADQTLITRFISISKEELRRAIGRYLGTAWDQSPLFKKICVEEYSMFGGQPYACLIGDYEFNHSPPDVEILTGTARIAAAAHAPFLAAASPSVMQMESWQEIAHPRSISKVFSTVEYAAWRSLRKTEESAYVGLTMPRFLARLPYGTESNQVEEFDFREDYGGRESRCYTWCNSAYAMGANIARAFKLYGWCARISGVESGGLVEDLPTHCFPADDGGMENRSPSEISISDRWEAELARNGFIPLVHLKNSDSAAFIGARSFHEPPTYDDPDLTAASALASRLPFRLTSCRFAQYMKCIVRDWIGSFKDRADMQEWLNRWIRGYVDSDPASSSEEGKARRPLADAEIVLDEIEGDPCHYRSKLYIRPHYQLEGLTVSLRLVSELPSEHPA